jgi:hypothetical protein
MRRIAHACSVGLALSMGACGATQTTSAIHDDLRASARGIIGTSLVGARGLTAGDQDAIDDTVAGLCGARVWTRSECARHDAAGRE